VATTIARSLAKLVVAIATSLSSNKVVEKTFRSSNEVAIVITNASIKYMKKIKFF